MTEPKVLKEFRLGWEMPPPPVIAYDWEAVHGRDVWPTLTNEQWEALPWKASECVSDDYEWVRDQYLQLKAWADSHQQPIRNVTMQTRPKFTPERWVDL